MTEHIRVRARVSALLSIKPTFNTATKLIPGRWGLEFCMYRLGLGTTCEAPFYLTGSELDQSKSFEVVERDRLIPCPSCQDCYL